MDRAGLWILASAIVVAAGIIAGGLYLVWPEYQLVAGADGLHAWRVDTRNGAVSHCSLGSSVFCADAVDGNYTPPPGAGGGSDGSTGPK